MDLVEDCSFANKIIFNVFKLIKHFLLVSLVYSNVYGILVSIVKDVFAGCILTQLTLYTYMYSAPWWWCMGDFVCSVSGC